MTLSELLLFVFGLVVLLVGAEFLVRGATRIAAAMRIPPLIIGLTVVAFGTSSPELAASVAAARTGGGLALGNVVGSNIFNVLFILGLAALITPLRVDRKLVRWDVPILVALTALILFLGRNHTIGATEGVLLVCLLTFYLVLLVWEARREGIAGDEASNDLPSRPAARTGVSGLAIAVLSTLLGLGMLTIGAGWLVDGAVALGRQLGISDLAIGLTVVAAGTSLPEVATSLLAAIKGERDLAVGNVVGSNIFNLLAVLGVAAIVAPSGIPVAGSALAFDLPFLLAVSLVCLPIFFTDFGIDRWEGGLFLGAWVVYTVQLLAATRAGVIASPVPIVGALVLGVGIWTVVRSRRAAARSSAGSTTDSAPN